MKNIYLCLLTFLFISCDGINQKDISIIENIRLGQEVNSFYKQLDSLGIKKILYYNVIAPRYQNSSFSEDYYFPAYTSLLFDFSEFNNRNERLSHPSPLIPVTHQGTKKVIGTIVLLGHTNKPWLFFVPDHLKDIYSRNDHFRQDINELAFSKILKSYENKYGKPDKVDTSMFNEYFIIKGNSIDKGYDETKESITYHWKTKYIDIKLFKGFNLNAIYSHEFKRYKESTNLLYSNPSGSSANPLEGQFECVSLPYIMYSLNEKAIKKLGIDKMKL
jgi:hypothetical protein